MPVGGGTSLGAAVGRVIIDLSDLQNVRVTTQQVGQEAERNLGRIGTGAKKAQNSLAELHRSASGLASAFGVSLGVAGAVQLARFAIEADKVATAYERQSVAAVNLAGSQAELNNLLAAYERATGGAIDRATALADVTRLQAVGFADSARELEQFATAARGISIATGQQQDYVISQLQLAIANQSTLRLDQLGLGVAEVKQRIDELKAANRGLTDEMAYQQAILGLAEQKFGVLATSAEGAATGLEQTARAWKDLQLAIGEATQGPLEVFGRGAAIFIDLQTARLKAWIAELDVYIKLLRQVGVATPFLTSTERAFVSSSADRDRGRHGGGGRSSASEVEAVNQDLLDAQLDYARDLAEINRNSARDIQQATEQYGRQRAETIRQYELSIVRDAEDFARQRARSQRDYERSIVQIMRDSQEQRAEWESDLAERTADAREQSNERIADMEEDFAKQRERAQRAQSERIADAAGRLDAIAVSKAQRDFARAEQEAREDFDDRLEQERENLQERIDQENEAHAERLEDARKADARRLEDMRIARNQQIADENEDRRIRLDRAAEDHQAQLDQQAIEHGLRIQQIIDNAADERQALQDAFNQELIDLGMHNIAVEAEMKRARDAELKAIEPFMKDWFGTIREAMEATFPNHPSNADPYISRDLPTMNSGYIPPQRSPTGTGYTYPGRSGSSFNGNVTINIAGSTNMGEDLMYDVARRAFVDALEEMQ